MELCVKLCAKPSYVHILLNAHNNSEKDGILYWADKKIENSWPT